MSQSYLKLERLVGIEPTFQGWRPRVLPLNYNRKITCVLKENWSGQRGSNPRHQPWQGCTLPLSYARLILSQRSLRCSTSNTAHSTNAFTYPKNFIWSGRWDSNPQQSVWKTETLPLSYNRVYTIYRLMPRLTKGNEVPKHRKYSITFTLLW